MSLVCSFSGGRSSGMMAYMMREQNPIYVFCNTGKEHPATLDFVQACSDNWGIAITWLEYAGKKAYRIVTHETAAREGEPFEQLITDRNYLPNSVARFCTSELKVLTIQRYLADKGIEDYDMAVGIRGDEPRRLVKMRAKEGYLCPLENITEKDVHDFWQTQSFDLMLPAAENNLYSNCDLCFLKGTKIRQSIIREYPDKAEWWIAQEKRIGARFRKDSPSYEQLKVIATSTDDIFGYDETIACFCGD